ncbi:ATP-binding SpoIIE family protein phosphatase [Jonesia quinghaiensis]|uniref:ATP-binding SpoIIE family protein phosphatase n=1 Tax=Jonesia quinghaiensis TaxID=262806 RepID=UPI00041172F0|nr:ATP-binding SpoIIE family protein phosphatase [Jonesia quinghaiensis]
MTGPRKSTREPQADMSWASHVMEHSPVPFVLLTGDFHPPVIEYGNQAFHRMVGVLEDLTGQTFNDVKITLRRQDKTSGNIETWDPNPQGTPPLQDQPERQTHGNWRHGEEIDACSVLTGETWTCDLVRHDGTWGILQAVVATHYPAGRTKPVWIVQFLPLTGFDEAFGFAAPPAQRALDALSQISELLAIEDQPSPLASIASIIEETCPVDWAGFFLENRGLEYSESIRAPRRGRHRTEYPGLDAEMTGGQDPVLQMLVGQHSAPIIVDLAATNDPGTRTRELCEHLEEIWNVHGFTPKGPVLMQAIAGRSGVLGLIVLACPEYNELGEPFDVQDLGPENLKVISAIARRIGTTLDNARLYEREHELAEALQQSMVPTQVDVAGLDVWTYYAPSNEHARVGGDWYDILYVDDHTVGVVVGDVVGHDLEAAAAMGQLRSITRSYAFDRVSASKVLERVDRLVDGLDISRQASMVYGRLREGKDNGSWTLEYARAGHLPPIVVRDGKALLLNDAGGGLIGFVPRARESATVRLRPGDVVLFYTDGLIERRDRSMQAGLQELQDFAETVPRSAASQWGELLLHALADAPEDDVALVVVRIPVRDELAVQGIDTTRSYRATFPGEASSVSRARHLMVRLCQEWDKPQATYAELVMSELAANAVLHGYGQFALRVFDLGDDIRIEVEDQNPEGPIQLDGHSDRYGGYGVKIIDRLATWGWSPKGAGKVVWAHVPVG